jgi:tetratricopeptide (TPR) repeat protein
VSPRQSGRVWAQRSLVREERGDLAGALTDLQEAIAIAEAKGFGEAWRLIGHRGSLRARLGDAGAALEDYRRALASAPPAARATLLRERAPLLRAAGDDAQADADAREAAWLEAAR